MEDVRRRDRQLWLREMVDPQRLPLVALGVIGLFVMSRFMPDRVWLAALMGAAAWIGFSYLGSIQRRFHDPRFASQWRACEDRLRRFDEVLKQMRKEEIADFSEMPATVHRLGQTIYVALRRADWIAHEVAQGERSLQHAPPSRHRVHDPQSQEMYRLADKNLAEYRLRMRGVLSGVQRTEAQTAVFVTTLDTLRARMMGYRLAGRSPDLPHDDFLDSIHEVRAQLDSIDTALSELELQAYPRKSSRTESDRSDVHA